MHPAARLEMRTVGDRELVMTRRFDAPRALVFRAWTEPALLRRWLTGPAGWRFTECEVDLRVGGRYRFAWRFEREAASGESGCGSGVGMDLGMSGEYQEIDRPARFIVTERFDESWYPGEALVQHDFAEVDGCTYYTATVRYQSAEALQAVLRSNMEQGVAGNFDRMDGVLAEERAALA